MIIKNNKDKLKSKFHRNGELAQSTLYASMAL